jgi:type IV pilus assembly protein PilW
MAVLKPLSITHGADACTVEDFGAPQTAARNRQMPNGFTLIELLIALFVGMIALGAIYTILLMQQRDHGDQRSILEMQQNLRGALVALEQEIRMAGYDPEDTGRFGIIDIRRYNLLETRADPGGMPALFFSADCGDGTQDNGVLETKEHIGFRIRKDRRLPKRYLTMTIGKSSPQRMAGNIEFIGFAFAVDGDGDGRCDTWGGGDHLVWAVDSDNDNLLDTHLDTNDDGLIDLSDDRNGDNRITAEDGAALHVPVPPDKIRAVRVWLLAVGAGPVPNHSDRRPRLVGDRIVPAPADQYRRQVMETIIECRNL